MICLMKRSKRNKMMKIRMSINNQKKMKMLIVKTDSLKDKEKKKEVNRSKDKWHNHKKIHNYNLMQTRASILKKKYRK